jgi:NAD(P) transhydrogenase subunit alpha
MRIGVPRETTSGEHRVALVPEVISKLKGKGLDVIVQSGAGADALLSDAAFTDAGAQVTDDAAEVWRSDVVVTIAPPDPQAIRGLGAGSILIGFLAPLTSPQTTRALADAKATAFAMEAIPRISRAQSMDALSSQSNVAGYRAALLGAEEMGRFYPMLMTAAGTIPPAKVLVLGVGVAGLQALATARRLGARTTGYDVRPEVAEQVQSLGAMWLDLGLEASGEGGYARELTDEERARQQQALTDAIKGFDVVITTALVPGRPAPKLVTAEAVEGMKPGSVIVDLAGEAGGNCELTEPGQTVVRHDVKIVSPLNLPATMAEHSSQLFARNVQALLELFVGEDGQLKLDFDDEIVKGACVVRDGEIVNPGAKKAVDEAASAAGVVASSGDSAAGGGGAGSGGTGSGGGAGSGDAAASGGGA